MKKTREQKGITLIALIITIVVLLILAAVAINSITNDGIIGKAQEAVSKYDLAQEKEKLQMEILEWQLINSNGTLTLKSYLEGIYGEENVQPNVDNSITVKVPSGNRYIVTKKGEVTLLDGTVEEPTPILPEITLDKTSITKEITEGETATENLTATLNNATGTLNWLSSNTSVAEISGTGNTRTITLKSAGTATITVSCGDLSVTCAVNVTEKQVVNLISFTVSSSLLGTTTTYYAEEGMAWEKWIGSEYDNSNGAFTIYTLPSGSMPVLYNNLTISNGKQNQVASSVIIDGGQYETGSGIG